MSATWLRSIRVALLLLFAVGVWSAGCTKMSERSHAKYELGKPFKFRPAEPGGEYVVKWSATADGPRFPIDGSQRTVNEGELLGFSMEENGLLTAIAGESRFPISPLPRDAKFFVWSTEFVRGSQPGNSTTAPATQD